MRRSCEPGMVGRQASRRQVHRAGTITCIVVTNAQLTKTPRPTDKNAPPNETHLRPEGTEHLVQRATQVVPVVCDSAAHPYHAWCHANHRVAAAMGGQEQEHEEHAGQAARGGRLTCLWEGAASTTSIRTDHVPLEHGVAYDVAVVHRPEVPAPP
jgi:hypothetical protein